MPAAHTASPGHTLHAISASGPQTGPVHLIQVAGLDDLNIPVIHDSQCYCKVGASLCTVPWHSFHFMVQGVK